MRSEFGNQEGIEQQLGELMKQTEHLATQQVTRCEFCGSQMARGEESEPCPECGVRPNL
jgi:rubrerythrin